jgi:uncharacterized surface protein with fasciclin (FAS1) repeats
MHFKTLAFAALAAIVSAQEQSGGLVETLSNVTELANLTTYLGLFPDLVQQLSQLQNVTLLAPSNEAFETFLNSSAGSALADAQGNADLIQAIFTYHVLNGSYAEFGNETQFVRTALQPPQFTNVTGGQVVQVVPGEDGAVTIYSGLVSTANVTGEPLNFTGGVVHIIDSVLVVPQNVSTTAVEANLTAAVGALTKADLAGAVDGLSDVTIFVPDNEAFDAIGNLLGNLTTENLTSILTYHVVNGTVGYSTGLENTTLPTLNGENITISIIDGDVFVNSARVIVPDVLVANGVVHIIDSVLNPANATAAPNPDDEDGEAAFEGASSTANDLTSGVPTPTGSTNPTESAAGATSSSSGGAMPMITGGVGAAALFGGAAVIANW